MAESKVQEYKNPDVIVNKSVGTVSTRRDEKGRATIYKNLSKPGRWIR